jgi:hypothetical protein
VTELPIVVETSAWASVIFGVVLILVSVALTQAARWAQDVNGMLGGAVGALVTFVLGLALMLQSLGWQLRVDDKGIALHAPFDVLRPGGEIAWADMTSLEVVNRPYRGNSFFLRVRGRSGAEILVANADRLPPRFGVALQKVVAERAAQVPDIKELAGQFEWARQTSWSVITSSYSARDGRGNPLR